MSRVENARKMGLARKGTGKDWTGTRFTRVVVIKRAEWRGNIIYWTCQCDCGKIFESQINALRMGRTKSCGCLVREKTRSRFNIRTLQNMALRYLKDGAKERNLTVTVSDDDLISIMEQSCYYCGKEKSNKVKDRGYIWEYNGVDRIDNTKGYDYGNCVPCCRHCNRGKDTLTASEFIDLAHRIALKHPKVNSEAA